MAEQPDRTGHQCLKAESLNSEALGRIILEPGQTHSRQSCNEDPSEILEEFIIDLEPVSICPPQTN